VKLKVLVTRAEEQAGEFAGALQSLGFEPLIFPVIEFQPTEDKGIVERAFRHLSSYDWILLTSANAVRFFMGALKERGITLSSPGDVPVCAVGPKTAEAAEKAGITIDLIPDNFQAEGVISAFQGIGIKGKKVLFPRAEAGRELLPDALAKLGARVTLVPLYRTVKPERKEDELKGLLSKGVEVITFTSGSTVRNFLDILGRENLALLAGTKIACISEVTAGIAEEEGLKTDIIPLKSTTQSLAHAIGKYFTG